MQYRSVKHLASQHGVSTQTIRRWAKAGQFANVRTTSGGHLRIGQPTQAVIGYARVSSRKQLSSIAAQHAEITRQYPEAELVSDVASGFNFKRRGLRAILERSLRGDSITVVVSDQDRIARTGVEFIRFVIESSGGELLALHHRDEEPGFNTETLVEFITSFCNSYYGKRSHRRQKDSHLPKE